MGWELGAHRGHLDSLQRSAWRGSVARGLLLTGQPTDSWLGGQAGSERGPGRVGQGGEGGETMS